MRHEKKPDRTIDGTVTAGFWRGCFNDRMQRCIAHGAGAPARLRRSSAGEIADFLRVARPTVTLASDAVIVRIRQHNPDVFQTVRCAGRSDPAGLFAYLPLNARGAGEMVSGKFDGLDPDPQSIAAVGELPEAFYFWMFHTPQHLVRMLGAVAALFRQLAPAGCPIFSRAISPESDRMQRKFGFLDARTIYPDAPDWLLVTLPEARADPVRKPHRPQLEVRIARDMEDLMKVISVRSATYLAEQFCRYSEEFDGNDLCSTQFIGYVDGDPAGCIRLRYFGDFAKLERLAVRKEYRKSKLAFLLVRAAIAHCRRKNFTRIYGHARIDLVPFWATFGFRPFEDKPAFRFANLEYVEGALDVVPGDDAIRIGVDPMVLTRPEGAWDVPGPLDLSNQVADPDRAALLKAHTKVLRQ